MKAQLESDPLRTPLRMQGGLAQQQLVGCSACAAGVEWDIGGGGEGGRSCPGEDQLRRGLDGSREQPIIRRGSQPKRYAGGTRAPLLQRCPLHYQALLHHPDRRPRDGQ